MSMHYLYHNILKKLNNVTPNLGDGIVHVNIEVFGLPINKPIDDRCNPKPTCQLHTLKNKGVGFK